MDECILWGYFYPRYNMPKTNRFYIHLFDIVEEMSFGFRMDVLYNTIYLLTLLIAFLLTPIQTGQTGIPHSNHHEDLSILAGKKRSAGQQRHTLHRGNDVAPADYGCRSIRKE